MTTIANSLPPARPRRAHACLELLSQRPRIQQVEEALHLARESFTVAEPPDLFHARDQVAVEILHAHHFFQPPASVRTPHPTRLHAAVWSFADAETRHDVVHHHRAGINLACQSLAAGAIARPHACG